MITITLQKINDKNPCLSGWDTILAAHGGENADMNAEFPLVDALETNGLDDVIWAMQCLPEYDREWRLFAVWCARQVHHLMTDPRSIDTLDVAERFANGQATVCELTAARAAAKDAQSATSDVTSAAASVGGWAALAASAAARNAASDAALVASAAARNAASDAALDAAWDARAATLDARDAQEVKLAQILNEG